MTKTQNILIAIGIGVGVAYLYKRYKGKPTKETTPKKDEETLELPFKDTEMPKMSREEKEEFILSYITLPQESVQSVPKPKMSAFDDNFFDFSNSSQAIAGAESKRRGINSVEKSENALKDLTEQEIEFMFLLVKYRKENPSITSDENAIKEMGISNPNLNKVFSEKLKKRLDFIREMKKDKLWKSNLLNRVEFRENRRKDFKEKMGFDKSLFERISAKKCGRKPSIRSIRLKNSRQLLEYNKCRKATANAIRLKMKNEIRQEVSDASVSDKAIINDERQKSFSEQVINRDSGGMFAGQRWDGKSNANIESLVDNGLV